MKKIIYFFGLLMSAKYGMSQAAGVFPRVLSRPIQSCENQISVSNAQTSNCNIETGCNNMYPVLVEDFDYNDDLPNKWTFDLGYTKDDNVDPAGCTSNCYSTWYADAYQSSSFGPNHNIQLNGGIMKLINIPENIVRDNKSYNFTSGMINSLSKFRTGIFEARIKIPNANKMWPAFWLLGSKGQYAEIDIFEFHDENVSGDPCDTYNLQKMTIHDGASSNTCHSDDQFPQLNISQFHDYKLVWNDTEVQIWLDGNLVGYATKYYSGASVPMLPCGWGGHHNTQDPLALYNCNQVNSLPQVVPGTLNINWGPRPSWLPGWIPWPPPQPPIPILTNNILQDPYFPNKYNAMSLLLTNSINRAYMNDDFSVFSQSFMTMEVDWIKVYQPFCCGANKTVCSIYDLHNQTYNTDILTGSYLNVGLPNNSCSFIHYKPGNYPDPNNPKRDVPIILLATDEIAIQGEAIFEGEQYVEARITDCGSSSFRSMNTSEIKQLEDFYSKQQLAKDSIEKAYSDSLFKIHYEDYIKEYARSYSFKTDADISVSPIPASDNISIECSDLLFDSITSLFLVDVNGKERELQKDRKINIKDLVNGIYFLKFEFKDGTIFTKKVIKI